LFVKHVELLCRWRFVEANQPELGLLLLAKERSWSNVSQRWRGRMKASGLKRHQLMGASGHADDHQPTQIKPRANGHSLSRHRFAWCSFQCRQLQDGGMLTLAQLRDQDNFSTRKLKRVVMHGWLV
jgi:hypothetical protein